MSFGKAMLRQLCINKYNTFLCAQLNKSSHSASQNVSYPNYKHMCGNVCIFTALLSLTNPNKLSGFKSA